MATDNPSDNVPESASGSEDVTPATPDVTETPETPTAAGDQAAADESVTAGLTLGSGAPADESFDTDYTPVIRGKVDRFGVAMGTGRRKTAVARVRIQAGSGKLTINNRSLDDYFTVERDRKDIEAPLHAVDQHGKVDVWVRVDGGGPTGQAGAIVLGIARALQAMDSSLHHALSDGGFLTRDGRMVERKKYGYKKARKSFQFSKR